MKKQNHLSPPPAGQNEAIDPQSMPADPVTVGSSVVFYGDPAQVRAGFALALQLMGVDEPVPDVGERGVLKEGDGE